MLSLCWEKAFDHNGSERTAQRVLNNCLWPLHSWNVGLPYLCGGNGLRVLDFSGVLCLSSITFSQFVKSSKSSRLTGQSVWSRSALDSIILSNAFPGKICGCVLEHLLQMGST